MKTTLLALLLLGSTAFAGPGSKVCKQAGAPLVSLRHVDDTPPQASTGAFAIWASGGFSSNEQDPKTHKLTNERSGCLEDADFKELEAALAKATWKFTTARIKCMAMSVKHTEWTVSDKVVWDDKMCSGKTADAATQKAIDLVHSLAAKVTTDRGVSGTPTK
jgi:hypothetical protein